MLLYIYNTIIIPQIGAHEDVACQGLYNRRYVIVYGDKTAGATTSVSLWKKSRSDGEELIDKTGDKIMTECDCCSEYKQWKMTHRDAARKLQSLADTPCYYRVCAEEEVNVGGCKYVGTIRALHLAPEGGCKGIASTVGQHPYTCTACEALQHGRNSPLLHKLQREPKLKHPRTETNRACFRGVTHKHASNADIQAALVERTSQVFSKSKAIVHAEKRELLRASWRDNQSARPFVEQLLKLFTENKLSDFDLNFLQNWLGKKIGGKYWHATEQARMLAILLSNRFGERMYSTVAPMMGLPLARQTKRLRAKDLKGSCYLPGLNDWAIREGAKHCTPYQNSMDGTRVVRTIELYNDKYLVGESFSPDVRAWPSQSTELPVAKSWEQVRDYVLSVRKHSKYAAEAYSFDLVDTTGRLPDLLIGSIPEATSGVTASHVYCLMLEVEKKAMKHDLSLTGHCTDSASNALNALLMLATPTRYLAKDLNVAYLGLSRPDFYLFAPFFRSSYPSIAYPCWDHSGRTVLRNLASSKREIVAEQMTSSNSLPTVVAATVRDLHNLKLLHPASKIKFGDISTHIRQNCDATARVLTQSVVDDLATYVPGSRATQLYLQAAVWTHTPFRIDGFGSPTDVARSLWAGLMTWRRWRQYVVLHPSLTLKTHFISRPHYITEELLVHAGINHLLCMYLCFPETDYSLRHTGNRGIESIHGMFRGGTTSLPITSPNLSFREFLEKMNKAQQMHRAEHGLKQIDGNTIVAAKKKRKTFALTSNEHNVNSSVATYTFPTTYAAFLKSIEDACTMGDCDSKKVIEKLAPNMANVLKLEKKWDAPDVPLEDVPSELRRVSHISQANPLSEAKIDTIMQKELGSVCNLSQGAATEEVDDSTHALANMLVDIDLSAPPAENHIQSSSLSKVLSGLQPQREVPNKNRGKRFATGELLLDKSANTETTDQDVRELQFWAIHPTKTAIAKAKLFLLGQVCLILSEGTPCRSAEINPSTELVLTIYEFHSDTMLYQENGRTGLLKAPAVLHCDISTFVHRDSSDNTKIVFKHEDCKELDGYVPFERNVNIEERLRVLVGPHASNSVAAESESTDEEDEEEIEKVVRKKFNGRSNQYEYLVKWKNYSEKHNTWELITNIPENLLRDFEVRSMPSHSSSSATENSSTTGTSYQLRDRQAIRPNFNPDYIISS